MFMTNPFDQLNAQDETHRLAQVSTSELADAHNPLDADKLPPYYCPNCREYKDRTNEFKTGYKCPDCECRLSLVNSCFEPPHTERLIDAQAADAWAYSLGIM